MNLIISVPLQGVVLPGHPRWMGPSVPKSAGGVHGTSGVALYVICRSFSCRPVSSFVPRMSNARPVRATYGATRRACLHYQPLAQIKDGGAGIGLGSVARVAVGGLAGCRLFGDSNVPDSEVRSAQPHDYRYKDRTRHPSPQRVTNCA